MKIVSVTVETRLFWSFANNSRSKPNKKKNPEHAFVNNGKSETGTKF